MALIRMALVAHVTAACLAVASHVSAMDVDQEQARFFEREVRPLFAERCFKCHGEDKQSGGLRLDVRANALAGGESGPSVVPGDLAESLLLQAVRYESFEMPPDGKLSAKEIVTLERWVEMGAPWPGDDRDAVAVHRPGVITDEDRQWWSFQPVRRPDVPRQAGRSAAINDVDHFIGQKLDDVGLAPAPTADRATLIRRVTFDLIGLPPTPAEVQEFVADPSADAYERLVERLLQRPEYGERQARHWLDLVRYADSDGYRADEYRPHAWRYRDYVIRSFNADKPYDRFVQEQLAGDELFPGDADALTATGFLRHGIYEYNSRDARGQRELLLDDITDTTADVFMGVGLQCARCHDHKFDPLLQADYFRLRSFFAGLMPSAEVIAATEPQQAEHAQKMQPWLEATKALREELAVLEGPARDGGEKLAIGRFPDEIQAMVAKPAEERTPYERQIVELVLRQVYFEWDRLDSRLKGETKDRVLALRKEIAAFDRLKPEPLPLVLAGMDCGPVAPETVIPKRGTKIEPGFLTILREEPAAIEALPAAPHSTGRRATLARWLTARDNPLTARVIVNRLWQQHFGKGLAANASDFGRLGEAPSHPELLDWLASELMDHGWSLQHVHRLMVLSATYRQSAIHPEAEVAQLKDPENRLLWRACFRRLDSEQIRDSLYAVSGQLKADVHSGPGAPNEQPVRSIFLRFSRNLRNPLLDVFDVPFGITSSPSRHVTTTPIQSLLMINSQMLLQQATAFDARLRELAAAPDERIDLAYQLLYGRHATASEIADARQFLAEQARRINLPAASSESARFEYDKIPYRDGQAAVMTPEHPPMRAPQAATLPNGDFTVEAFVVVRSIYDNGAVRVITSSWSGNEQQPGWSFGITGKGSRRKPQTLVMQLVGPTTDAKVHHDPVFSDHTIQLNKPYYLAAVVRFPNEHRQQGTVDFFVKDLSNDDEPTQTATVPHRIVRPIGTPFPITVGGRRSASDARFDGLLDDVRITGSALAPSELLYAAEVNRPETVAFWRFEANPDVFADLSGHGHHLTPLNSQNADPQWDAERQAWIDLCHVLLNSSEFLYVQ